MRTFAGFGCDMTLSGEASTLDKTRVLGLEMYIHLYYAI